jgi:hypothetical protein
MMTATVNKVAALYDAGQTRRTTEVLNWESGGWAEELGEQLATATKSGTKAKTQSTKLCGQDGDESGCMDWSIPDGCTMLGMADMDALLQYAGKSEVDMLSTMRETWGAMKGLTNSARAQMQAAVDAGTIDKSSCESDIVDSNGNITIQVQEFPNGGKGPGIPYQGKNQEAINKFNIKYAERCNAIFVNILVGGNLNEIPKARRQEASFRSAFQVLSCKKDGEVEIMGKATTERGNSASWCGGNVEGVMADGWFRKVLSQVRFKAAEGAAQHGSNYLNVMKQAIVDNCDTFNAQWEQEKKDIMNQAKSNYGHAYQGNHHLCQSNVCCLSGDEGGYECERQQAREWSGRQTMAINVRATSPRFACSADAVVPISGDDPTTVLPHTEADA